MKRFFAVVVCVCALVLFPLHLAGAEEKVGIVSVVYGDLINGQGGTVAYYLFGEEGTYSVTPSSGEVEGQLVKSNRKKVRAQVRAVSPSPVALSKKVSGSQSVIIDHLEEVPEFRMAATSLTLSSQTELVAIVYFPDGSYSLDVGWIKKMFTEDQFAAIKSAIRYVSYDQFYVECREEDVIEVFLGKNKGQYMWSNGVFDIFTFAQDVMALLETKGVDTSLYDNISFVANDLFGDYAYGGGFVYKSTLFQAIWIPAIGVGLEGIFHEKGHSIFGLWHLNDSNGYPYGTAWSSMSGNFCLQLDPEWLCVPITFNASERYAIGFLADGEVFFPPYGTSFMELTCFDLPPETEGFHLVRISVGENQSVDLNAYCKHGEFSDSAPAEGILPIKVSPYSSQVLDKNDDNNDECDDSSAVLEHGEALNLSQLVAEAGDITVRVLPDILDGRYALEIVNNNQPPMADFYASPESGNAPLEVSFFDQSTGYITSRQWNFGDGEISNETNPKHVYQNPGQYVVKLSLTGPAGFSSKELIVSVYNFPVAGFTVPQTSGNAPFAAEFTNTSTGEISSYQWSFGDGAFSSLAQPGAHVYQNSGNYTVTLTVTGPGGTDTEQRVITVLNPLSDHPVAGFTVPQTSGNAPFAAEFTNTSTGEISSYQWNFGDGATSSLAQPGQHTYLLAGEYEVALTVTGPGGADTRKQKITVLDSDLPDYQVTGLNVSLKETRKETKKGTKFVSKISGSFQALYQGKEKKSSSVKVSAYLMQDGKEPILISSKQLRLVSGKEKSLRIRKTIKEEVLSGARIEVTIDSGVEEVSKDNNVATMILK